MILIQTANCKIQTAINICDCTRALLGSSRDRVLRAARVLTTIGSSLPIRAICDY